MKLANVSVVFIVLATCLCFSLEPALANIDLGLASGSGPKDGFRGGLGDFLEKFANAMMDEKTNKSDTDSNMRKGLVETIFQLLNIRGSGFENKLDYGLDGSLDLSLLPAPLDMRRFIRDLVSFLEQAIPEYIGDPETLLRNGLIQNPFPTSKFPDATQFPNGDGTPRSDNKFAWAADFNESCGIGLVVHSAGSPGVLGKDPAFPTLTLRDASAEIIFQNTLPELQVGIRSALVVGCDPTASTVKVLLASVGDPGEFLLLDVNLTSQTYEVSIRNDLPADASSVRRMTRLDDGDQCYILVAPMFNIGSGTFLPPVLYVVDVCDNLNASSINFNSSLQLHSVWDFECSGGFTKDDLTCWFNLITFRPAHSTKAVGIELVPKLFFGSYDSSKNEFDVEEITTSFSVDASAFSLLPIGDGGNNSKALVCTMSGFVYQVFGNHGNDLNHLGNIAESLELGDAQECQVCDTATKSCTNVALPGLVDSNAYVWDTAICGDYVFVGTLDLASMTGDLLFEMLTGIVDDIDATVRVGPIVDKTDFIAAYLGDFDFAEASDSEIVLAILGLGKSVLASLFFEDVIGPEDFGFDIWYINYSDLEGTSPTFQPLTVNGFRGLEYKGSEIESINVATSNVKNVKKRKGKSSKGSTEKSDITQRLYSMDDPSEDGVRNMVCHRGAGGSNPILVVGSAVYGKYQQSSTFTLDLSGSNANSSASSF